MLNYFLSPLIPALLSKHLFIKHFLSVLILLSFIACQNKQPQLSSEDLAQQDKQALHIGILPVMECLPLYYAQQMGIFNTEGVEIHLQTYLSQMDCDTAILHGQAEIAYSDIARVLLMPEDIRLLSSIGGQMSLITAKSKRIRQLKNLDERMIAIDRLSQSDYWSDELMKQANLDLSAIYRPQINDIQLRTSMLTEQLVDAALLPEPYATMAVRKGNKRLFSSNDTTLSFSCFITSDSVLTDTMRVSQIHKFFAAYNKAVTQLNSDLRDKDSLHTLLHRYYNVPTEMTDFIQIPSFRKAYIPSTDDINNVALWLKSREYNIKSQRTDSLCSHLFVQ